VYSQSKICPIVDRPAAGTIKVFFIACLFACPHEGRGHG
jgi:hypothetical protein